MAQFLVTGGCGFIGSHLVEALLRRGDRVRILDNLSTGYRDNVPAAAEVIVGDVVDFDTVSSCLRDVDGVFHLAAVASVQRTQQEWLETHAVNQTGCINVFEAARRQTSPIPVVFASSAAVYGETSADHVAESSTPHPISAYGADKLGCELHGQVATKIFGVDTVGLRLFNVYGPRQDASSPYSGVIAIFADRVKHGEEIEIHGDGAQIRDFIFVRDAVDFFLAAMTNSQKARGSVLNVCTGRGTSIRTLAETICQAYGKRPQLRFTQRRGGDIRHSIGNPSLARRVLGCSATTEVSQGLVALLRPSHGPHRDECIHRKSA